jgi:hypothetical protein
MPQASPRHFSLWRKDAFNYPNVTGGGSMGIERSNPFANGTVDEWAAAMLGESMGRVIAPAEFLEMFHRAALRADVQVRDARAMVGVKYAAS